MGKYNKQYTGTMCLASSISFYPNKHITCGEGGAFMTHDIDVFNYIKKFSRQGQTDKKFIHDIIGVNYRITNIQSAMLYGQLELLDEILKLKINNYNKYILYLDKYIKCGKISIQKNKYNTEQSYWMFALIINGNKSYNKLCNYLICNNIESRPLFYDITYHKHLYNIKKINTKLYLTPNIHNEVVILPSYPELTDKNIQYICKTICNYIDNEM